MRNIKYKAIMIFSAAVLLFGSCAEDMPGTALQVNYPTFVLAGEDEVTLFAGDPFTDPGATANEDGNDLEVSVTKKGTYFVGTVSEIDTSIPDLYSIIYSAENSLGYAGTAIRSVTVLPPSGDLVTSLEGVYISTVVRNAVPATEDYIDMEYIYIRKVDATTYELSDGIGGYYDFGRVYGPDYAAKHAVVTANDIPGNDFSFNTFGVGLFGGTAEITSMTVNAGAKTISFTTEWDAGYTFVVTLTQVEIEL